METSYAHVRLDALTLLDRQPVNTVQHRTRTPRDACAVKVYGSQARRDAYAWLTAFVGSAGPRAEGCAGAVPERAVMVPR